MKQYGLVIAKLRKRKGLTQEQLGKKLNVSYQAISKWENNLAQPDLDTIEKLTEIFEISMAQFFEFAKEPEKIDGLNSANVSTYITEPQLQNKTEKNTSNFWSKNIVKSYPWVIVAGLSLIVLVLSLCAFLIPVKYTTKQMLDIYNPSVFFMSSSNNYDNSSVTGTGFFINNSGLAVTSYDNIQNYNNCFIKLSNGEQFQVKELVGVNETRKIAIIQTTAKNTEPVKLGNGNNVNIGDKVYSLTYTYDDTIKNAKSKIMEGSIYKVEYDEDGTTLLQSTATTKRMNKGGVLFNEYGYVIGFISDYINISGSSTDTVSDCVPINYINDVERDVNTSLQQHLKDKHGTYTIVYNPNGGNGYMLNQTVVRDYYHTIRTNNFTKTGYAFAGWRYNGKLLTQTSTINLASDGATIQLIAEWQPITYSIIYHLNGGTNDKINFDTYTILTRRTLYSATKKGYDFEGWYTDRNFTNKITVIEPGRYGTLNLYAKYSLKKYSIAYHYDDKCITTANNPSFYTIEDNITFEAPDVIEGYKFDGWYTDSGYKNKITNLSVGSYDTNYNLYAKVSLKNYTITYHLDVNIFTGTSDKNNPTSYNINSQILTLGEPTKKGYTFAGFYYDSEYKNQFLGIQKGTTGNIDLYAKWQPIEYTVTLDANGGECDITSVTVTFGEPYDLPIPQKTGYAFDCWVVNTVESSSYEAEIKKENYKYWGFWSVYSLKAKYANLYIFNGNKVIALTEIGKEAQELTIPSEYNNTEITEIADYAFSQNNNMVKITIPDTIKIMGNGVFSMCENLTEVKFLGDINELGQDTFFHCEKLEKVNSLGSITEIPHATFSYCKKLENITIPNGILSIGGSAFLYCESLKSVTLPNGVLSIGVSTFRNCSSLTQISIPSSVTTINSNAFSGCESLSKVEILGNITEFKNSVFDTCKSLKEVNILGKVAEIPNNTFYYCESLTSINIPNGTLGIGDYAFGNCISLNQISIPTSVTTIGKYAFNNCESLISIEIPDGVEIINDSAFYSCEKLINVTIPASVKVIGQSAFWTNVEKELIINYLGSINDWAQIQFNSNILGIMTYKRGIKLLINGEEVSDVEFSTEVTKINAYAFRSCTNLVTVIIPASVTTIGECAFDNCLNLSSVVIQGNETEICHNAFSNCPNLTQVTLPSNLQAIADCLFLNCEALTNITLPNTVTSIGYRAFASSGLINIVIPNSVTTISVDAFYYCIYLQTVTFEPDSQITTLEEGIFQDCWNLTEIVIPSTVTSIGKQAFAYCSSFLTNVVIPSSVTTIGDKAFENCSNLQTVTFEENSQLQTIGEGCFSYCTSLQTITIPNGVAVIDANLFENCTKLKTIILPQSILTINLSAFNNCDIQKIYYMGLKENYENIALVPSKTNYDNATIYYYTETIPTGSGNYWHFDDDGITPIVW